MHEEFKAAASGGDPRRRLARLVTTVALVAAALMAPGSAHADTIKVKDPDSYESYFLGAKSAKFTNGKRRVTVRAAHGALWWDTVDLVRFSMLTGRLTKAHHPPYATQYTAIWEAGKGVRLERQSPGQEFPVRVRCKGLKLRHSEEPARLKFAVPTRCLPVPKASRPSLAKGGGNDLAFAYLVHNAGGDVTETVPGKQSSGAYPSRYTRWVNRAEHA